ncbi:MULTISPECIES: efflux RND transporter periplasmic adaptor subunit [unclassified Micromonospora]|uniref:efflux RND transporter periplasmic adaptor subunit n=1 Tax=unclassified Micromonospora TaxID=2617518 RepID=UPI001C2126BA|nr:MULTISPECIES: efflux RND transporter periplasmic adaptor subunit [unclassified Micromonospora]MBU8861640.1 efflux RND transporter periplasmic adaptor subunit [Micromonospora sp. WMMB482]MDM4781209.1 efflux RND transporter periplasmic adaptor subunit [Micromonospora sp. b486]
MRVRRLIPARGPSLFVNAGLAAAVLLAGGWAYTAFSAPETAAAGEARTVPVSRATVTSAVSVPGSVRSAATASATFATAGQITEITVAVGDPVKKGQVLAKVDASAAKRELAAAEADLDAARDAADRAAETEGSTTQAEAAVTQAELKVAAAREKVDGATLTAPIAGTVVAVNGSVGDSGTPAGGAATGGATGGGASGAGSTPPGSAGEGLVQIADLTRLEVSAAVPEADATRLKAGMPATVSWNALPGTTAEATLAAIDPNATTADDVVTYGVTLSLKDRPDAARPGQSVQVTVTLDTAENVVAVSALAVTSAGNRNTVTVLDNGTPVVRPVEVGLRGDQLVEIISGLTEGDRVVLPSTGGAETSTGGGGRGGPAGGGLTGGGGRGNR